MRLIDCTSKLDGSLCRLSFILDSLGQEKKRRVFLTGNGIDGLCLIIKDVVTDLGIIYQNITDKSRQPKEE